MREMGKAMMGTGEASGEKRAIAAAEAAISNPLLDDVSMKGARGLLISITGGRDLTLYEVDEAATRIREEVDPEANIILGATFDERLEGTIRVSVVATGLAEEFLQGSDDAEAETDEDESGYGYAAPQPAAKTVAPAPVAAKPQVEEVVKTSSKCSGELQEVAAPAPAPAARHREFRHPKPRPQMPAHEDSRRLRVEQMAAGPEKLQQVKRLADKRKGLLERLATFSGHLGGATKPAPAPEAAKEEPKIRAPAVCSAGPGKCASAQPAIDPSLDDDHWKSRRSCAGNPTDSNALSRARYSSVLISLEPDKDLS